MRKFVFIQFLLLGLALTACTDSNSGPDGTTGLNPPPVYQVTRENYLNGQEFCQTYQEFTSKEYGIYVPVPRDYSNPAKGSLQVYAYTMAPFNPNKPSYIYIDGGPGQNTHGVMPEFLNGQYNEIRFDQRGLGCSAPENFDIYANQLLYSSQNTVLDMEEIRKAYKISKWTVFGISYGTVPATMYGSQFKDVTVSVVLEGVYGRPDQVHLPAYKAEKINLVVKSLNSVQRIYFTNLIEENSDDTEVILSHLFSLFYSDRGMRQGLERLNEILPAAGGINRSVIENMRQKMKAHQARYPHPQQPGGVDENIFLVIACKNLNYRNNKTVRWNYDHDTGFYTETSTRDSYGEDCDSVSVLKHEEVPYRLQSYPVEAPVYYFQGSHDGATMAIGAISHWKTVPRGKSYFMLAQKGGHNPNMDRIDSDSASHSQSQKTLFGLTIAGQEIQQSHIDLVNQSSPTGLKWILSLNPERSADLLPEMDGFKRFIAR